MLRAFGQTCAPRFPQFLDQKIHLFIASIRVYNNSPEVWVRDSAI
jgi:hypothetical protein